MSAIRIPSTAAGVERFDRLYQESPDPWSYQTSDYERKKYAATLAALPKSGYGLCLEIGCSIGAFTKLLAARCEHVVALDFSWRAIELAHENLRDIGNVDLVCASFPDQLPHDPWDLIICSEVLYYLEPGAFDRSVSWMKRQLARGACLLAVSWRGVGIDEPMRGDEAHDRLTSELARWHALDARNPGYRLDRFDGR